MARHPFRNIFLGRFIVCHKEIDIELDAVWIQESGQNIGKKDLEQSTEPFFRVALFVIDIKGIDVRSKAQDQEQQIEREQNGQCPAVQVCPKNAHNRKQPAELCVRFFIDFVQQIESDCKER